MIMEISGRQEHFQFTVMREQTLLAVTLLALFTSVSAHCSSGQSGESARHKCFFVVEDRLKFAWAERLCNRYGGHLASMVSDAERYLVLDAARNAGETLSSVWIGLKKIASKKYAWTDHTVVNYTDFRRDTKDEKLEDQDAGSCIRFDLSTKNMVADDCFRDLPAVCIQPNLHHRPAHTKTIDTCDPGWTLFSAMSSCYKVLNDLGDFYSYRKMCASFEARLTTIHSAAENKFIAELASGGFMGSKLDQQVAIGLYRSPSRNDTFIWGTRESMDFVNWADGEPNYGWPDEDCVMMFADKDKNRDGMNSYLQKWNDITCTAKMRAGVCKKQAKEVQVYGK